MFWRKNGGGIGLSGLRRGTFPAREKYPKARQKPDGFWTSFPADKQGICRTIPKCSIDFPEHRCVNRFPTALRPPIGTLPRNRLASSATGGASAISCAAAADTLKYRSSRAGGAMWASPPTKFDAGFLPFPQGLMPTSARKRKDSESPTLRTISGSGASAETILHLRPLAKHSQTCGMHPNGLNSTGRAKDVQKPWFLVHLWLLSGQSESNPPETYRHPKFAQSPILC